MGEAAWHPRRPTLVGWLMRHRATVAVLSALPIPLWVVRSVLRRDNVRENRRDSWDRLRDEGERARYVAVRRITEKYAPHGLVVDVGCSQGILQEGLRYERYVGVDTDPDAVALARRKANDRTRFVCADGASFVPDEAPAAVVLNEVVYYLDDPLAAVRHYTRTLAPGGVVIISIYALTWSSRRLLRTLARRMELLESELITSDHLAWTVAVYRPAPHRVDLRRDYPA